MAVVSQFPNVALKLLFFLFICVQRQKKETCVTLLTTKITKLIDSASNRKRNNNAITARITVSYVVVLFSALCASKQALSLGSDA